MQKPLWNSFRDPPPDRATGSAAEWNKFGFAIKMLKVFVFVLVFGLILISSIIAKITFLLMTAQISTNDFVKYCDIRHPNREIFATMSNEHRIPWIWILIFAFSAPEVFTFLRVARVCYFKNIRRASISEFSIIVLMEILHTIGLSILTFLILPNLNSSKGLMLINCVCFVPAVLGLLSGIGINWKSLFIFLTSCCALCAQITGLFLWPVMQDKFELWLIPLALVLISCRWWENFCSALPTKRIFSGLLDLRQKLTESRSYIYLYLAPLKIIVFALLGFAIDGQNFSDYFQNFGSGWSEQTIALIENLPIYTDRTANDSSSQSYEILAQTSPKTQIGILLLHIFASYMCYICAKFSCKIKIQEFSMAFALSITSPLALTTLYIIIGLRETDVCVFNGVLADYISYKSQPNHDILDFIENEYIYAWLLWWISQLWIVRHVWFPYNDKNASTEKLFIAPWYSSLLIDQCIMMNRRVLDQEKFVEYMDSVTFVDPENIEKKSTKASHVHPNDSVPQLIVCATMWHEEEEEMMQFLKSIIRLDEDQCARRMAKKYLNRGIYDEEYYELECNIFFDDAFITDQKFCADPTNPPINSYVETLAICIEKSVSAVYGVKVNVQPPTKTSTPYGGRLVWTLPGRNKLIAHLKNNDKIRNKKRWSQVMYMYYLLGYRIMEMDAPTSRKIVIAQNTFLLALDGDIDFQPQAVQLLLGRMKVDPDLGAACGRIHPVGQGPMVWYQVFEYAIGHWLQKATEHVIGCVLCSPGCFSLFRGRALMEDSVMKKYTTNPTLARHYVQYDQGEDRWLCTLLLKQKFRVEYSAASDAYTHAPENFNDFYIQRRRWIPSTIANILDLLGDAKTIIRSNNSISMPYIIYQGMIMVGTILGPGTIFLMMVGSLVTVFNIDIWTSFMYNFLPVLSFMLICFYCKQKYQLIAAFIISSIYCLVMMAVLIGIIIQVMEDGIMSPASLFFVAVAAQIVVTGLLHPQEAGALICGVVYYITIPSMYMLLLIYSVFNMNDVSWGTREKKPEVDPNEAATAAAAANVDNKKDQTKMQQLLNAFRPNKDEEGSLDFSFAGVFRCMFCTHPKSNTTETQLLLIADRISDLSTKVCSLEKQLIGDIEINNGIKDKENLNEPKPHETKNKKLTFNMDVKTISDSKFTTGWLDNQILRNFNLDELSREERKFWDDLIKEYLHPLFKSDEEKGVIRDKLRALRNIVVFAFVMINSLFVLVVFLLQIKKSYLHIRWPFNAKDTIEFDKTTFEVIIYREYLELDPIGSCFVLFFGSILAIQFCAMLVHRFATISQILAATTLNWFWNNKNSESSAVDELRGNGVEIARKSQRPRKLDDDDSDQDEKSSSEPRRRNTLYKLHDTKNLEADSTVQNDLQTNFELRFQQGKLKFDNIPISRKSVRFIEETRKSIIQDRSQLVVPLPQ